MKILIINHPQEDYLADTFIIGLKLLYGKQVFEYPLKKILYQGADISNVRGNGFTYYQYLPQTLQQPAHISDYKEITNFDWVIFTSIYRQYDIFKEFFPFLNPRKTIILDGEDKPNIFLYAGKYWKNPKNWFATKPHHHFPYFKREITPKTYQSLYFKLVPTFFFNNPKNLPQNIYPISFGIPDSKVIQNIPEKKKLFTEHIVDEEVKTKLKKHSKYVFTSESDYYQDLRDSQFGITMQRAGWDCLRHYELAANGCVLCFKNLELKPKFCAPHDLIPGKNCISYKNYDDLINQVHRLKDYEYENLVKETIQWAISKKSTTIVQQVFDIVNNLQAKI